MFMLYTSALLSGLLQGNSTSGSVQNQGQLSGASGGTLCNVVSCVLQTVSADNAGLVKTAAVPHNIHSCTQYIEFKLVDPSKGITVYKSIQWQRRAYCSTEAARKQWKDHAALFSGEQHIARSKATFSPYNNLVECELSFGTHCLRYAPKNSVQNLVYRNVTNVISVNYKQYSDQPADAISY